MGQDNGVNVARMSSEIYIRLPEVCCMTGLSKSTVMRYEKERLFPKRHRLSKQVVGWLESEVAEWVKKQPGINFYWYEDVYCDHCDGYHRRYHAQEGYEDDD